MSGPPRPAGFYTPYGVTSFGTATDSSGSWSSSSFYTPYGVTSFGTYLIYAAVPGRRRPGFYTPYGVTSFGTVAEVADGVSPKAFLYALRRDLVWDILALCGVPKADRQFLYALRRDLVWDADNMHNCLVLTPDRFLYALRRDLVWDRATEASPSCRSSGFYTPYGVTSFGTRRWHALLEAFMSITFLYALRRDLVWDTSSSERSRSTLRPTRFYTPYGVTSFGTSSAVWSSVASTFLYALRRDLVWDSTAYPLP